MLLLGSIFWDSYAGFSSLLSAAKLSDFRKPDSRISGGHLLSMGLNPVFFIVFCPMGLRHKTSIAKNPFYR